MAKKAIITISLIKESIEKTNQQLEREIYEALSEMPAKIPWLEKVENVKVTD